MINDTILTNGRNHDSPDPSFISSGKHSSKHTTVTDIPPEILRIILAKFDIIHDHAGMRLTRLSDMLSLYAVHYLHWPRFYASVEPYKVDMTLMNAREVCGRWKRVVDGVLFDGNAWDGMKWESRGVALRCLRRELELGFVPCPVVRP